MELRNAFPNQTTKSTVDFDFSQISSHWSGSNSSAQLLMPNKPKVNINSPASQAALSHIPEGDTMSQLLEEEEENTKITLFVIGRYHDLKVHCRRPISVFSIQGPCFIFHKNFGFSLSQKLLYHGVKW